MATINHYKVLQVDPEAEAEVIQAAYRRLARKYHPDVAQDTESAARMAAINAAWAVLRDPVKRARYDRESLPPGKTWEAASTAAPGEEARPADPRAAGPASPPQPDARNVWGGGSPTAGGTARPAGGHGAAGAPPGNPAGSVLNFGRYTGWSLGEVARHDPDFLEWLDRMPIGRPYHEEIDRLLRGAGLRASPQGDPRDRHQRRR